MEDTATAQEQPQQGFPTLITAYELAPMWDDSFGSVCPDCNLPLSSGQCPGCGCAT